MKTMKIVVGMFLCLMAGLPAYAQEWYPKPFKAVFEEFDEEQKDTMTYYVGDRSIRMEMTQEGEQMIMLLRYEADGAKAYMLMPARKMYMHVPMDEEGNRALMALAVPVRSPLHPCNGQWSCKNLGRETVAGRTTEKYTMTDEEEGITTVWIDSKLYFPVQVRDENDEEIYSEMKLLSISPGPQPAYLFELPKEYQLFSY